MTLFFVVPFVKNRTSKGVPRGLNNSIIYFGKKFSLEAEQTHTLYVQTFHLPKSTRKHTLSKKYRQSDQFQLHIDARQSKFHIGKEKRYGT